MSKRKNENQIVAILKEADAGMAVNKFGSNNSVIKEDYYVPYSYFLPSRASFLRRAPVPPTIKIQQGCMYVDIE